MAAERKGPVSRNPQDYFGSGTFDADHFDGDATDIALDTEDDPARPPDAAASSRGVPGAALDGGDLDLYEGSTTNAQAAAARVPSPVDRRHWPTGTSPDSAALVIDPADIAIAADYGQGPANIVFAIPYAVRAIRRKRDLGTRVKEFAGRLAEAERRRDALLVQLAQDLRDKISASEAGVKLFEPIAEIEKLSLARRSALAGTSAEYQAHSTDLDAQTEKLASDAGVLEKALASQKAELSERERDLARATARKKRLYIEVRSILDLTEKTGGQMTPEHSARIAELEGVIASHEPELLARTRSVAETRALVQASEEAVRAGARRLRDVERMRRMLDGAAQKQIGARSESVSQAEAQRQSMLADLGRLVLAERGRLVDPPTESLDAITKADSDVSARAAELEKFARARGSYDAKAVRNGLAILIVLAVSLVVLVVVLVAR